MAGRGGRSGCEPKAKLLGVSQKYSRGVILIEDNPKDVQEQKKRQMVDEDATSISVEAAAPQPYCEP
ncbi:UNVERIFIED_CONTAM: hypothetical protein Sangu_1036000 [Sesamum angustifolium]|uniref:Uncharacterized protein n=1 Tax=Sesamum angustifolium TaxID=2727405 RepID=A0AAW2NWY5_9LAMI